MSFFGRLGEDLRDILKKADLILLGLCLAATVFGIVLIASATQYTVKLSRCVPVQAAAAFIGIIGYFVMTVTDVEHLSEKWKWFFVFNLGFIGLLLTSLGAGKSGNRS